MNSVHVTPELLARYDRPGPRYTSYPTVPEWKKTLSDEMYREALTTSGGKADNPLSLYVHIPFCRCRCAYCGCNVLTSPEMGAVDQYLNALALEIEMVSKYLGERRMVAQCHWGGGTPAYLNTSQMRQLFDSLRRHFTFCSDAEMAIETNPCTTSIEQLGLLRSLGFNRISFGVQDLDPEVQRAVGRDQTVEATRAIVQASRDIGFSGINIDLIYGLPLQRLEPWRRTLEEIISMSPDRIAIYSYAHLPQRFEHQRKIDDLPRPGGAEKYRLFAQARQQLVDAGYRAIGMDHFAAPGDELSLALDRQSLHRNFMGYTVRNAPDQVGFGVSAISEVNDCYSQNTKDLEQYSRLLRNGELPVENGVRLSFDDSVRRWVIRRLMCDFVVDPEGLLRMFSVAFKDYFTAEEQLLSQYVTEGFLEWREGRWMVTTLGAPFVRNLCMIFDAYLDDTSKSLYSNTI